MSKLHWKATKEENLIHDWDQIQLESPKGMFTQCSSWLNSYHPYGFTWTLFLGLEDGQIKAGFACLILKFGPFKLINCTWGPYLEDEDDLVDSISQFRTWAISQGALALQVNLPQFMDSKIVKEALGNDFSEGNLTAKIFSPLHFNWIHLPSDQGEEADRKLLKSFSENARRNVKSALKNELEVVKVTTSEVLREAYQCFENNAIREGYSIRNWNDLKPSLTQAMEEGHAIIFLIKYEGQNVGAIWAAKGGGAYHYIMGGTERLEKDLKLGHLLQWAVMKASMEEGLEKYNISVGGSDGVVRFKSSFYPKEDQSLGVFHLVLSPVKFRLFQFVWRFAERNKKLASRVLKLIK